jgi:CRP-like cAMP-binding protein
VSTCANRLLALLPAPQRRAVLAAAEECPLVIGQQIHPPGTVLQHVHFPTSGYVSLVSVQPGTPGVEVGLVGHEGFVGIECFLGLAASPLLAITQGTGSAARIPAAAFRDLLKEHAALDAVIKRYVATVMTQFATSALCLRFHDIPQRLARWLLMMQDRAGSSEFKSTHELLSYMLGVRRAGVTEAAVKLQEQGAIHYDRGNIVVVSRALLERAACGCYAIECTAYDEAMA